MPTAKTGSVPLVNGNAASSVVAKATEAGRSVTTVASRAKGPMLAAAGTAAGLAGGLALGARMSKSHRFGAIIAPRRKVLGVQVGRKNGVVKTAETLAKVARELQSASTHISSTTDDVRQIREQLEHANNQSPIEVLLNGLTHRRRPHKKGS
jgi:hypothetical protein